MPQKDENHLGTNQQEDIESSKIESDRDHPIEKISCPHCYAFVPANQPRCTACGKSLNRSHSRRRSRLRRYDIAYSSFLFSGAVMLLSPISTLVPLGSEYVAAFAFWIAAFLAFLTIVAWLVGIVFTVIIFRHWPLIVLSLLTILFTITLAYYGLDNALFYHLAPAIYGIVTVSFSLMWFLKHRNGLVDAYKSMQTEPAQVGC